MQPLQYYLRDPAAKDTIVLRMQPQHEATLTQPLQCDLQRAELQNTIEIRATASEIAAPKPDRRQSRQKDDFEALFKRNFNKENY